MSWMSEAGLTRLTEIPDEALLAMSPAQAVMAAEPAWEIETTVALDEVDLHLLRGVRAPDAAIPETGSGDRPWGVVTTRRVTYPNATNTGPWFRNLDRYDAISWEQMTAAQRRDALAPLTFSSTGVTAHEPITLMMTLADMASQQQNGSDPAPGQPQWDPAWMPLGFHLVWHHPEVQEIVNADWARGLMAFSEADVEDRVRFCSRRARDTVRTTMRDLTYHAVGVHIRAAKGEPAKADLVTGVTDEVHRKIIHRLGKSYGGNRLDDDIDSLLEFINPSWVNRQVADVLATEVNWRQVVY